MKKEVAKVATSFDCPFCNHAGTVECSLNRSTELGTIKCRVCDTKFQTTINYMTEPIDVFSEWIDECEKVNAEDAPDEEE
eukprot:CAMPEP_0175101098 /NCGR_PEP_ID=MMETSP0086_2-20121207/7562_1 /TAXON_ID=136419 /ORGANISM="Unknown Unknown, Strain D1" /LENGTH=79 /DNA_ID=CAMNT_0016375499 /DNA_START=91 /DNA_END=330 /DNA_ORIENTATION=+